MWSRIQPLLFPGIFVLALTSCTDLTDSDALNTVIAPPVGYVAEVRMPNGASLSLAESYEASAPLDSGQAPGDWGNLLSSTPIHFLNNTDAFHFLLTRDLSAGRVEGEDVRFALRFHGLVYAYDNRFQLLNPTGVVNSFAPGARFRVGDQTGEVELGISLPTTKDVDVNYPSWTRYVAASSAYAGEVVVTAVEPFQFPSGESYPLVTFSYDVAVGVFDADELPSAAAVRSLTYRTDDVAYVRGTATFLLTVTE